MRKVGAILSAIMKKIQGFVRIGLSTLEIDQMAEDLIRKEKVSPAFKGYRGYPATICTSINEEIVHGLPSERRLKEGDIISLDLGISCEGYFADIAVTQGIGRLDTKLKRLIEVTREALAKGIKQARVNNHLSDISYAIQNFTEAMEFQGIGVIAE